MWRKSIWWLVVPVGVMLAGVSWSAMRLARDVADVQSEVATYVGWLRAIQVVQEAAGERPPPPDAVEAAVERLRSARLAMVDAFGDDRGGREALETLDASLAPGGAPRSPEVIPAGHTLVRMIRGRTARASRRLSDSWQGLNRLVMWTILLSIACMGLLVSVVIVRGREVRLWQQLQRLSEHRVAMAEQARGTAVARYRADLEQVIEMMPAGVAVVRDGLVVYGNARLADLFDRDAPAELVGEPLRVGENLDVSEPISVRWDEQVATIVVVRDLTHWNAVQGRLRLADRMASVGTMASGIAHEINNPLTYMRLSLDELREEYATVPPVRALVDAVEHGAERIQTVVRDLSAFSRSDDSADATTDLPELLRATARMASYTHKHRVHVEVSGEPIPSVSGDEAHLGQVFFNLIANAVQAVASQPSAGPARVHVAYRREADWVIVEVSDEGPGIAADDHTRLFDPFFTTRPIGEATGLGLFICHQIVTRLQGTIEVDSVPGEGATFRVGLRIAEAEMATAATPARPPQEAADVLDVLILDDEPMVGRALQRLLRQHRVVVVQCVDDARRVLPIRDFDVVLCDVNLPDEPGRKLYEHLQQTDPALARRLVFITGGILDPEDQRLLDGIDNPTLDKPVVPEVLRSTVQTAAQRRDQA